MASRAFQQRWSGCWRAKIAASEWFGCNSDPQRKCYPTDIWLQSSGETVCKFQLGSIATALTDSIGSGLPPRADMHATSGFRREGPRGDIVASARSPGLGT
jgi:hypothetical protein